MIEYRPVFLAIFIFVGITLLQTTLLDFIAVRGIIPDLALILLVFLAVRRGSMNGQVVGFLGGIVEDIVSLSPLGFHSLIRALLGFLSGLLHGIIILDLVFVPFFLIAGSMIIKGIVTYLMALIFSLRINHYILEMDFWFEALFTSFLAPGLFFILGLIPDLRQSKREKKSE